jgi:hypothetical protein
MALLDLPENIRDKIENGDLKPSLAEELLAVKNSIRQNELCNIIVDNDLTTERIREIVKDDPFYCENSEIISVRKELQSFNKAVIALRITMRRLAEITEEEENYMIKELIMYNTKTIHELIDITLKEKKKYAKRVFRYRKILNS